MSSCQKNCESKKISFMFNYSTEQMRYYIANPFDKEKIFLNEDSPKVFGFKDHIIKTKNQ